MSDIHWFRRGDGAEFAVQPGTDAETNLIGLGAMRIEGPGKGKTAPEADVPAPTKAELRERADALGLELPSRATNDELTEAIAAEEARLAAIEPGP